MKSGIRAVFFDAAGTLIHLPKGAAFHYVDVARRHGLTLDQAKVHDSFRSAWHSMPAPVATYGPRPDDDRSWWKRLVDRVLDQCAPEAVPFDRDGYFGELYEEFIRPGVWDAYPETRMVLEALSERYTLVVVSNFDGRLRPILRGLELDIFFQATVISSEVGADKPDPWIFEQALRAAGVEASRALHVGDEREADWEGGRRAGLHAFELSRPKQSLADVLAFLGIR